MLSPLLPALVWTLALGASPAEQAEARDLSRRSIVEYNGGEFEKALADIQRAYDLDPRPGMLFNLAQCHRGLEHWKKAKFFYEGYLREFPDAPNRKSVRALLDEVVRKVQEIDEKEAAARAAAQRPPDRGPTEVPIIIAAPQSEPILAPGAFTEYAEPETHKSRTAGWILGGIGLGAAATGTVLAVLANGITSKGYVTGPTSACPAGGTCYNYTYSAYGQASTEGYAADVLWGVGGALVVTGVILLLTSH